MDVLHEWLGLDEEKLSLLQMVARSIVIFFCALLLIRLSGIRTLGKHNVFDQLTLLMLGAIMGRAIVAADQPFFESILAAGVIMLLHRLISWITWRQKGVATLLEGAPIILYQNGRLLYKNLKRTNISEEDIHESLRRNMQLNSIDEVDAAYLERSGDISFVKKEKTKSS